MLESGKRQSSSGGGGGAWAREWDWWDQGGGGGTGGTWLREKDQAGESKTMPKNPGRSSHTSDGVGGRCRRAGSFGFGRVLARFGRVRAGPVGLGRVRPGSVGFVRVRSGPVGFGRVRSGPGAVQAQFRVQGSEFKGVAWVGRLQHAIGLVFRPRNF